MSNRTTLYDCKKCGLTQEVLHTLAEGIIDVECIDCKTLNKVYVEWFGWFEKPTKYKLIKFKKKNDTG